MPFNTEYFIIIFSIIMSFICIFHLIKKSKNISGHRTEPIGMREQVYMPENETKNDPTQEPAIIDPTIDGNNEDTTLLEGMTCNDLDMDLFSPNKGGLLYETSGNEKISHFDSENAFPDKANLPESRYDPYCPPGSGSRKRIIGQEITDQDSVAPDNYDDMYI